MTPSSPASETRLPNTAKIEVSVRELRQIYDTLDPSPFHERELNREADDYIVGTARELGPREPLVLVVYLQEPAELADEQEILTGAVHAHYARRAEGSRRQLRELFRRGRVSLLIGLICLAAAHLAGEGFARLLAEGPWTTILRESLVIGGWVAMWRPLEMYLYDWWPIRDEQRVFQRLARMEVRIVHPERK